MWQISAPVRLVRRDAMVVFCGAIVMSTPCGVAAPRVPAGLNIPDPILRVADDPRLRDFNEAQRLLLSNGVGAGNKAVELFRSAADQGNALAEYDLGYCYEFGIGVPTDGAQALAWYRRTVADTQSSDLLTVAISSIQHIEAQFPAVTYQPALAPEPIAPPPAEPATAMNASVPPPQPIAPPVEPVAATNVPSPPPPPPANPLSDASLPANVIVSLISRGNEMLRAGNVSAARSFFTRAAMAGSSEAALTVGETYDRRFLAQIGAKGLVPDSIVAGSWYHLALALGNHDATLLLAGLDEKPTPSR